jgi:hypothetical protein
LVELPSCGCKVLPWRHANIAIPLIRQPEVDLHQQVAGLPERRTLVSQNSPTEPATGQYIVGYKESTFTLTLGRGSDGI